MEKDNEKQPGTHDDFRRLRRRGWILHDGNEPRQARQNQVRGKAAKKAAKRERMALRAIRQDIAENGI